MYLVLLVSVFEIQIHKKRKQVRKHFHLFEKEVWCFVVHN